MASVYCWFDWEDDTTTVNSISVIQEPRKPWNEYEVGERIVAKLPKYGRWGGVIVEISGTFYHLYFYLCSIVYNID